MEFKFPVLLDGAMGTMLQRSGLKPGEIPEIKNITDPEMVRAVYRAYAEAGSQAIYANTFGANRLKLAGTGYTPRDVITAAVRDARAEAARTGAMTGLDVGPIGTMLAPLGTMSFEEAYDIFAEMMKAGAEAGADMIEQRAVIALGNDTDLRDAGIDKIRERKVDEPVSAAERHRAHCTVLCEIENYFIMDAGKDQPQYILIDTH